MGVLSALLPSDQPRWLTAAFGPALLGHAIAGFGLYWDVAWHVDIGRDEKLLTAPHSLILVGLLLVALGASAGLLLAKREGTRISRGLIAMAVSVFIALMGFPLDELWHRANGIDVTMWSPTHMLMIGGGGMSVVPLWFALSEAGVLATAGRRQWLMHYGAALTLLGGLSAFQGEFDFGVPQFQLLYQPVLILMAGALVLTAARVVLGRGGALFVALGFLAFRGGLMLFLGGVQDRTMPRVALYLGSALLVEAVVALRPATRGLLPLAMLTGATVGTLGLASEWIWASAFAWHPWPAAMVTETVLTGLLAAVGGALLGIAIAAAVRSELPAPRWPLLAAGTLCTVVALAVPFPRTANLAPQAAISYEPASVTADTSDSAKVRVVIGPPDAPYGARWWEVMAWQGGGLRLSPLLAGEGSGVYETADALPTGGDWKLALRLHRGSDMVAATLRRPAAEGVDEVPLRNGFITMQADSPTDGHEGDAPGWLGPVVLAAVFALMLGWAALTVRAGQAARAGASPQTPRRHTVP